MSTNAGFIQQQPLHLSACVRSALSPQHGGHLNLGPAVPQAFGKPPAEPRPAAFELARGH